MANKMRWRYGDTKPVTLATDPEHVIEIGDLVYMESGMAYPAASQDDLGTKAENQEGFHDAFVGVAMQASPLGSSQTIRIATAGVFEFDATSGTPGLGQLMGPAGTGSGGNAGLANQTIEAVATANLAVGRCAKLVAQASTIALVDIVSTTMYGGPQAPA